MFPDSIAELSTDAANSTPLEDDHPGRHNDVAAEVNAIEATLGLNPEGSFATVAARLDASEDPPYVSLVRSAAVVAASSNTPLAWSSAVHNPDGWWSSGSNITPNRSGLYRVTAVVNPTQNWNGARLRMFVAKNGSATEWENEARGPDDADGWTGRKYQVVGEVPCNGTSDAIALVVFNGVANTRLVAASIVVRRVSGT